MRVFQGFRLGTIELGRGNSEVLSEMILQQYPKRKNYLSKRNSKGLLRTRSNMSKNSEYGRIVQFPGEAGRYKNVGAMGRKTMGKEDRNLYSNPNSC